MKVISQREFRNNSAAVMDAVEAGEVYHVTRNGVAVAELRPLSRMRRPSAEETRGASPEAPSDRLRAHATGARGNPR
jgi:prevent-host-death family protein